METAPDGSPVPLYRRLPARRAEADLIHARLPAGAAVLDLGCGTGRLSEPLAALGHPVTGVDNEPAMLAALRRTTGVLADVTTLDLRQRFQAVLLMSHFVNTADDTFVHAVLRTARRHLADGGLLVVERYPPGWVRDCRPSDHTTDGVRIRLTDLHRVGEVLTATVRYEFDGLVAEQRFSAVDVDDARLATMAAPVGLRVGDHLDESGTLVALHP